MKAYLLKDLLNNRGGQIKKSEILKMDSCEGEKALKSSIRYLVDLGLAVETKETVQAKTVTGKLVPVKEIQKLTPRKETGVKIPSARTVGAARAARMRAESEAAFPARLEALRQGATYKAAFGSTGNYQYFVKTHPELAKAIEDAREEGVAKTLKAVLIELREKVLEVLAHEPAGTDKLEKILKRQVPLKIVLNDLEKEGLIARERITLKWRHKLNYTTETP